MPEISQQVTSDPWLAFAEQTHSATREVYNAMAQLYEEHPEFRKQLDPFHPSLAVFMAKAMKVFADRELS